MQLFRHFPAILFSAFFVTVVSEESIAENTSQVPDMQGVWFFGSKTPHERPVNLGNKRYYTRAEALAIELAARVSRDESAKPGDPDRSAPAKGEFIGQEAEVHYESARINLARINGEYRTSLIVDPADGRLPYKNDAMDFIDAWVARGFGEFDGPESRPPSERCVNGVGQMAPLIGWKYNANMLIVQTPDYVVLAGETHPPRIIPVSGNRSTHGLGQWMGESVGRWEGGTLIVHTTNFKAAASFFQMKSSDALQVTEWFTLESKDRILYRYTITDPKIYTQPFTVEMNIVRRPAGDRLFEWACHEANYSMRGILAGARVQESEHR